MLQNAYFLAKIDADTAENQRNSAKILPEFCQNIGNYPTPLPRTRRRRTRRRGAALAGAGVPRGARLGEGGEALGLGLANVRVSKISKFCKFLAGSFSAVSKRNFASKYAFDSIFQALQDLHTFAPLLCQHFSKIGLQNQQI